MTNPGSGFTTATGLTFTLVGGNAPTTAASGFSATLTSPGVGYTSAPTVIIGLPSTANATATSAAPASGSITQTGLALTSGGLGYTSAPTVAITGGGTPIVPATAIATINPTTARSTA